MTGPRAAAGAPAAIRGAMLSSPHRERPQTRTSGWQTSLPTTSAAGLPGSPPDRPCLMSSCTRFCERAGGKHARTTFPPQNASSPTCTRIAPVCTCMSLASSLHDTPPLPGPSRMGSAIAVRDTAPLTGRPNRPAWTPGEQGIGEGLAAGLVVLTSVQVSATVSSIVLAVGQAQAGCPAWHTLLLAIEHACSPYWRPTQFMSLTSEIGWRSYLALQPQG